MSTPFKIIDLFAGPGGLDMAAKALDIPVVMGIEWDEDACTTRRAAGLPTETGDVRKYNPSQFPEADVLVGGPPCQTFTVAGNGEGRAALEQVLEFAKRYAAVQLDRQAEEFAAIREDLGQLSDERTGLVLEPLRWALEALAGGKPYQVIVLEQVPAVLPVWRAFGEILESKGYKVAEPEVLHTEEFGVPQTRRRAILIARWAGDGARFQADPKLPEPSHRCYRKGIHRHQGDSSRLPWATMQEALGRTDCFEVVSNYGTGGDPRARGRRRHDEPSATVTGKASRNKLVWGEQHLGTFSLPELGMLQTFSRDYPWRRRNGDDVEGVDAPGVRSVIAQQIGNAVPPRLGMHVLAAALGIKREDLESALKLQFDY
ncbi:DNA cytosine methyltransferase [Kitasatospora sp. MMS16-BH015]|uniref:DNA cytosine methyltransferase n=1 Tax=Kitasatospora sp. MMS16-BH015 TaxID=2018025 RepID=UPI000CA36F9E|nr:DNA cytosine methyltransferase [Kitasatospora sp. MMS16-BH015]AUG75745.1 DNA cytosine methyltransferase [Kitasatospora sp. MMS16-BH015]